MFLSARQHKYTSNLLRTELPIASPPRVDLSFSDYYATFKLTEFDKILQDNHNSLKRVGICKRPKKLTQSATPGGSPAPSGSSPALSSFVTCFLLPSGTF